MSKVFISFDDKKRIYNSKNLISRLKVKTIVYRFRKTVYDRYSVILRKSKVQFTDYDIDDVSNILEQEIYKILDIIVEINKEKDPGVRRTLVATDIQYAIKLHKSLS